MSGEIAILGLAFAAVVFFVMVGVELFGRGWSSYEESYVAGAEKTLDSMYLTVPPQLILYMGLALFALVGLLGTLVSGNLPVGAIFGLICFFIPQIAIQVMKQRRDTRFGLQLVDALDTMSNALKAGLSLPQAFELIHQEMENPIRQEFRLLSHEMKFGLTVDDALQSLQRRMTNPDLALMATAIAVAQEVGGNLAGVFENIAGTIRDRHRVEMRVRAMTAQGRLQGIVLCLLPVALCAFLTFAYPALMSPLYDTGMGWALLTGCVLMMLAGGWFTWRIVQISV